MYNYFSLINFIYFIMKNNIKFYKYNFKIIKIKINLTNIFLSRLV